MSEAICHCNTYRKLPGRFPKLADSLEFQLFLDYDHPLLFNDHTPTHQLGNLKPLTWSSAFVWREEIRVSQFIYIYLWLKVWMPWMLMKYQGCNLLGQKNRLARVALSHIEATKMPFEEKILSNPKGGRKEKPIFCTRSYLSLPLDVATMARSDIHMRP